MILGMARYPSRFRAAGGHIWAPRQSNYYAVPGNLDNLGVSRDRVPGFSERTLRRRMESFSSRASR